MGNQGPQTSPVNNIPDPSTPQPAMVSIGQQGYVAPSVVQEKGSRHILRKIFIGLGVLFLLTIVGINISFINLFNYGANFDKESKAFVDQEVPAIISSWNEQKLISNADPKLLKVTSPDKIHQLLVYLSSHLGTMTKYNGSQGQAAVITNNGVTTTSADYAANADFQKGSADITITLLQHPDDKKWYIIRFHVGSPTLITN